MSIQSGTNPLGPAERRTLLELLENDGERAALKVLRISRNALYRCLAGLPVRYGTALAVHTALADLGKRRAVGKATPDAPISEVERARAARALRRLGREHPAAPR